MIEQGPSDHPIDGPTADDGGGAGGDAAGVGLQDAALAASLAELSQLPAGRVGLVELLTRGREDGSTGDSGCGRRWTDLAGTQIGRTS